MKQNFSRTTPTALILSAIMASASAAHSFPAGDRTGSLMPAGPVAKDASFADQAAGAKGFVCQPSDNQLIEVALKKSGDGLKLATDPLAGKVTWKLRAHAEPAK